MNNDIEANDNGNENNVGQPETERQQLQRLRREFEARTTALAAEARAFDAKDLRSENPTSSHA